MGTSIASYGSRTPWFYQTVMLGKEGTICTVPPHGGNVRDQHHAPALVSSAARDGSVASVRHEVEGVKLPAIACRPNGARSTPASGRSHAPSGLGRALLSFADRRGFKSNHKTGGGAGTIRIASA